MTKIKPEFIPILIVIAIACLNLPLVVILKLAAPNDPNFIGNLMRFIIPIELFAAGIALVFSEIWPRRNKLVNPVAFVVAIFFIMFAELIFLFG